MASTNLAITSILGCCHKYVISQRIRQKMGISLLGDKTRECNKTTIFIRLFGHKDFVAKQKSCDLTDLSHPIGSYEYQVLIHNQVSATSDSHLRNGCPLGGVVKTRSVQLVTFSVHYPGFPPSL